MTPVVDIDAVRTEFLRRMTRGNLAILREVEQYATAQLGKMLRPRLTLAAAATLGTEVLHSRRTLLMAVCVEMLHNASLFHDDIIDRAATRRGQPSINARWGNGVAVLVGDYILAQIMDLLDEVYDREAQHIVNGTVQAMVEAELLALTPGLMNEERYLRIIDGKTAQLFATACHLGNPIYHDFGLHYGRIFQMRDDIADNEAYPFTEDLLHREEEILATLPQLAINI